MVKSQQEWEFIEFQWVLWEILNPSSSFFPMEWLNMLYLTQEQIQQCQNNIQSLMEMN